MLLLLIESGFGVVALLVLLLAEGEGEVIKFPAPPRPEGAA
jgi:hypothetical protein